MKQCIVCKNTKPLNEFNYRNKKKKLLFSWCRSCQKVYKNKHYASNKQWYLNRNKNRRIETKIWWKELKSKLICEHCGEDHPATLDFHHLDPNEKDYGISNMLSGYRQRKNFIRNKKMFSSLCQLP